MLGISQHFHVDRHILSDLRIVDIQVDNLCLLGISLQVAGYTVIETHTDSNQHVTFVCLAVRSDISMHPQHTFI